MSNSVANTSFLVVEDNPYDLHAINRSLSRTFDDWSIYTATSLQHMQNVLSNKLPAIGIVDYHLPDATGLDAIKTLKDTVGDIPVILVTAGIQARDATEALKLGAIDYVEKDHNGRYLTQLTETVQSIITQPQYVQLETDHYRELLFVNDLFAYRNGPYGPTHTARKLLETICRHFPQHTAATIYVRDASAAQTYCCWTSGHVFTWHPHAL